MAFIALGKGPDPRNIYLQGMELAAEWELVHVDCRDPLLVKGLIL